MLSGYLLAQSANLAPPDPVPTSAPAAAAPPLPPQNATAPAASRVVGMPNAYASLAPLTGLAADPARSISYAPLGIARADRTYGTDTDDARGWMGGRGWNGVGYHLHLPTAALGGDQVWSDTWPVPYVGPLSIDNSGTCGPIETPEMRRQYRELYRREPSIRAAVNGKADAVACLDVSVIPRDNHKDTDCEAAEFVKWTVENTLLGWDGLIRQIVAPALIDGFSVLEKTLQPIETQWGREWAGKWGLLHCRMLDTAWLRLQLDQYRNVLSVVNLVRGLQYYNVDKFVLFSYSSLWNNPFGQSDLRACIRSCALIEDAYKLWYLALKMFGMPYLHGKVEVPAQRQMMADALEALRAGGYAVTGVQDEIELLNLAAGTSFSAFEANIRAMREDNFMAIRGAYLPFLEGVGGPDAHGNTAISKVASDTNTDLLAKSVARVISHQLVPWLVKDNFPVGTGYPTVVLGGTSWDEVSSSLEVGLMLADQMGLPLSKDQVYKRANWAPPDGPDDVVDLVQYQQRKEQASAAVQMQVQAQQMQMQAGMQMQQQQNQQSHEQQMQQIQGRQPPPPGGPPAGGGGGGSQFELSQPQQFSEGVATGPALTPARAADVARALLADLGPVRAFADPVPPSDERPSKPTYPDFIKHAGVALDNPLDNTAVLSMVDHLQDHHPGDPHAESFTHWANGTKTWAEIAPQFHAAVVKPTGSSQGYTHEFGGPYLHLTPSILRGSYPGVNPPDSSYGVNPDIHVINNGRLAKRVGSPHWEMVRPSVNVRWIPRPDGAGSYRRSTTIPGTRMTGAAVAQHLYDADGLRSLLLSVIGARYFHPNKPGADTAVRFSEGGTEMFAEPEPLNGGGVPIIPRQGGGENRTREDYLRWAYEVHGVYMPAHASGVFADFLQERGHPGAQIVRAAGVHSLHGGNLDVAGNGRPGITQVAIMPPGREAHNEIFVGAGGEPLSDEDYLHHDLVARPALITSGAPGVPAYLTLHHRAPAADGGNGVRFRAPVYSRAHLRTLTADLPTPMRTALHARLDPHLPESGHPEPTTFAEPEPPPAPTPAPAYSAKGHGTPAFNPPPHPAAGDATQVVARRNTDPLWIAHRGDPGDDGVLRFAIGHFNPFVSHQVQYHNSNPDRSIPLPAGIVYHGDAVAWHRAGEGETRPDLALARNAGGGDDHGHLSFLHPDNNGDYRALFGPGGARPWFNSVYALQNLENLAAPHDPYRLLASSVVSGNRHALPPLVDLLKRRDNPAGWSPVWGHLAKAMVERTQDLPPEDVFRRINAVAHATMPHSQDPDGHRHLGTGASAVADPLHGTGDFTGYAALADHMEEHGLGSYAQLIRAELANVMPQLRWTPARKGSHFSDDAVADAPPRTFAVGPHETGDFHHALVHAPEDKTHAAVFADFLQEQGKDAHAEVVRGHGDHNDDGTLRLAYWPHELGDHEEGRFYARPQSVGGVPHVNLYQLAGVRHGESADSRHVLHWAVPTTDRAAQFALLSRLRKEGARPPGQFNLDTPDPTQEFADKGNRNLRSEVEQQVSRKPGGGWKYNKPRGIPNLDGLEIAKPGKVVPPTATPVAMPEDDPPSMPALDKVGEVSAPALSSSRPPVQVPHVPSPFPVPQPKRPKWGIDRKPGLGEWTPSEDALPTMPPALPAKPRTTPVPVVPTTPTPPQLGALPPKPLPATPRGPTPATPPPDTAPEDAPTPPPSSAFPVPYPPTPKTNYDSGRPAKPNPAAPTPGVNPPSKPTPHPGATAGEQQVLDRHRDFIANEFKGKLAALGVDEAEATKQIQGAMMGLLRSGQPHAKVVFYTPDGKRFTATLKRLPKPVGRTFSEFAASAKMFALEFAEHDDPTAPPTDNVAHAHRQFQASIDASPHEATNHLVYADFLQEQGDHHEAGFRRAMGEWMGNGDNHHRYAPRDYTTDPPAQLPERWMVFQGRGRGPGGFDINPNVMHDAHDQFGAVWNVYGQNDPHADFRNYRAMEGAFRAAYTRTRRSQQ